MNKRKLEREVSVLSEQISNAHILILEISEIINQFNLNFDVYKEHCNFFTRHYNLLWNELIHNISRLQDATPGVVSIANILERNMKLDDKMVGRECKIFEKIKESDTGKKIKVSRNKLNKAHLDGKASINPEKQRKLWEKNKTKLGDVATYVELLTKGLEVISFRLDIPIWLFKPNTSIRRNIRKLFKDLKGKKS